MSRVVLARDQVRQVDRLAIEQYGMSGLVLMENAGRGVVDTLWELGVDGPVVICCGRGNNAGDGFVIGRHLELRGASARVVLWSDPQSLTGDAGDNFRILAKTDVPITILSRGHDPGQLAKQLDGAAWIIDALLGTGARGEPRPPLDQVLDQLNAHAARRLAVDLPSGLDCDTGHAAQHTFRADHTCTFVAVKPGFLAAGADSYTGQVHVVEIGVPHKLVRQVASETA
jgi:NAD(P)H-hydrate epimerase